MTSALYSWKPVGQNMLYCRRFQWITMVYRKFPFLDDVTCHMWMVVNAAFTVETGRDWTSYYVSRCIPSAEDHVLILMFSIWTKYLELCFPARPCWSGVLADNNNNPSGVDLNNNIVDAQCSSRSNWCCWMAANVLMGLNPHPGQLFLSPRPSRTPIKDSLVSS
jgi:hypothetical protein